MKINNNEYNSEAMKFIQNYEAGQTLLIDRLGNRLNFENYENTNILIEGHKLGDYRGGTHFLVRTGGKFSALFEDDLDFMGISFLFGDLEKIAVLKLRSIRVFVPERNLFFSLSKKGEDGFSYSDFLEFKEKFIRTIYRNYRIADLLEERIEKLENSGVTNIPDHECYALVSHEVFEIFTEELAAKNIVYEKKYLD